MLSAENHKKIDYKLTILQMKRDFHITGIPRLMLHLQIIFDKLQSYFSLLILLCFEMLFITDLFGITSIFTSYLNIK
jgi:hypothetical protein